MTAQASAPARLLRRARAAWDALPPHWRLAIQVAVALRLAVAVLSFAFGGLLPGLDPVAVREVAGTGFRGWPATSAAEQGVGLLGASLERFDALWYLAIARDGYPVPADGSIPGAAAFYPAYPLLVGLVGRLVGGRFLLAANVVSFAATVAALAGVHRLAGDGDPGRGTRAVLALAVFPASFFLLAPYTESLFLAVTVWALVLARDGRWAAVVPLGVAAGVTRNVGVLLGGALLLEVARQRRRGAQGWRSGWALSAVASPLAGLGLVALFGLLRYGAATASVAAQSGWQRVATAPWTSLARAIRFGIDTPGAYATGYHSLDLLVALPVLAAVVWLVVRDPRGPYGWYAAAHVLVWLVYPFPDRPLMSTARFALGIAPLVLAIVDWTARPSRWHAWLAGSSALLGVHLLLFVDWYWVF